MDRSTVPTPSTSELRACLFGNLLFLGYKRRVIRKICLKLILKYEGGQFYSHTARRVLKEYHGVEVGAYSYGQCMVPGSFPAGVTIGRYVSIGPGVRVFLRNHPWQRLSMHPFFYNHVLGLVVEDTIDTTALAIMDDAWIGADAIITPGCNRIGLGAVVGAGAVVTRDVEDFSIIAGNPARKVRQRFSDEVCQLIKNSCWWERPVEDCGRFIDEMNMDLSSNGAAFHHPLLVDSNTRVGLQSEDEES